MGGAAVPWQQCGADAEVHFWTPARDAGPPPSQAECVLLGQLPPALLSRGLSRGPLLRRASLGSIFSTRFFTDSIWLYFYIG